jgi:hypothetical protein
MTPEAGNVMIDDRRNTACEAKRIYEDSLRESLERSHLNDFVAIEPVSGDHFLGHTLSEAISASRAKYPDRLAHAFRVGHNAAIHFGYQVR